MSLSHIFLTGPSGDLLFTHEVKQSSTWGLYRVWHARKPLGSRSLLGFTELWWHKLHPVIILPRCPTVVFLSGVAMWGSGFCWGNVHYRSILAVYSYRKSYDCNVFLNHVFVNLIQDFFHLIVVWNIKLSWLPLVKSFQHWREVGPKHPLQTSVVLWVVRVWL